MASVADGSATNGFTYDITDPTSDLRELLVLNFDPTDTSYVATPASLADDLASYEGTYAALPSSIGNFAVGDENLAFTLSSTDIPKPATLARVGGGLAALGAIRRRRARTA